MLTRDPIEIPLPSYDQENGAVITFAGVVRSSNNGRRVTRIDYDAYPEMAERVIERLTADAVSRFSITSAEIVHRVGEVMAGEASLLVVVRSAHRGAAFDASRWIVEEIKDRVPIWKKEHYDDDTCSWL